jgi:hypothetical protein
METEKIIKNQKENLQNSNLQNQQLKNLHLHMGLTRTELKRRLDLGLIDPQILNSQVHEFSQELKLDALCESWIESHSMEQVDKYLVDTDN